MKIKYQRHSDRINKARLFWKKIATEYNKGKLSAAQIAKKNINPKTGKPYTRAHIYYALRKLREEQNAKNEKTTS